MLMDLRADQPVVDLLHDAHGFRGQAWQLGCSDVLLGVAQLTLHHVHPSYCIA
jgi:hypothetical protein